MQSQNLFEISDLNPVQLDRIFLLAQELKSNPEALKNANNKLSNRVATLVFFEPSTRTRVSFEMAAHRLGVRPILFNVDGSTSSVKGETNLDTLLNLEAMGTELFVIRSSEASEVKDFYSQSKVPCLNAGFGGVSHPTQALLDAFTLKEKFGNLEGKKLIFVGDVKHSRVAQSNLQLLTQLDMQIGFCSPRELVPESSEWLKIQQFNDLEEALEWCDVAMMLRTQKERHLAVTDGENLIDKLQLNTKTINALSNKSLIMHPGPFVDGEEMTREILSDSRSVIHQQVENGVWVRAALIYLYLTGEWK